MPVRVRNAGQYAAHVIRACVERAIGNALRIVENSVCDTVEDAVADAEPVFVRVPVKKPDPKIDTDASGRPGCDAGIVIPSVDSGTVRKSDWLLPTAPTGIGNIEGDSMRRLSMARARACLVLAVTCAGIVMVVLPAPAQATPMKGDTPWSVLLCKFRGTAAEPQNAQFFQGFITGLDGVAGYFVDQSRGRVTLRGSVVRGWYQMLVTLEQSRSRSREQRIQDCVDAAAAGGYRVPSGNRVIAIINAQVDSGSSNGRVLLDPGAWNVAFAAHEMLHNYGLDHSFSNDTGYQNAPWSQPGEYDDEWDEMSAAHVHSFQTARFGASGVALNAYHRDELGWLPRNRIMTLGADGRSALIGVSLAPLEVPTAPGVQLIRIPFDPNDLFHYYTVEYRRRTGWSAGIPRDTVLIHEVRNGTPYLLRNVPVSRDPVQVLDANGVHVVVHSVNGNTATVSVGSGIVERCVPGYVWREARPSDKVCVTGATRSQVRADNAVASSRWVNGAFGVHTCTRGYVWREAFAGDDVCVKPAQRTQARADNATAADRRNAARFLYGPNRCKSGYVWREADQSDYACVSSATRNQVRADNAVASSRWVNGAFGVHTCTRGYVWREAFVGDDVCVKPAQRTQARADNATAASRVLRPGG